MNADRLDLLRCFVRIVETGSLTAAARALGLTQPSVSRQLKALEQMLGAQLMQRTTHTLALTETGETVLTEARRLLADWEALADQVAGREGQVTGLLRVIAPVALGQGVLVDMAAGLMARHPGLTFDWRLTDAVVDPVAEGADCVIRVGPITEPDLIARPIGKVRRVLVAAPAMAVRTAKMPLEDLPVLVIRPFYGAELALTNADGARVTLHPPVVFASGNVIAVHRAMLAGMGMALMPTWLIAEDLAAGRLVRIAPDLEGDPLTIALGLPMGRYRPARLTAFADALAAHFATWETGPPGGLHP